MKQILVLGHRWPESKSSAAGTRIMQLVGLFKTWPVEVHFASTASKTEFSDDIAPQLASVSKIHGNDSSFDNFVKGINPDIVVFDRFMTEEMFGWRVMESCPTALRVLDTEDLHFLRKARETQLKHGGDLSLTELQNHLSMREVASIFRCDLSLMISEFELELLTEHFQVPKYMLCYWPIFKTAEKNENDRNPGFDEREGFMFIGNFQHRPNLDSVHFLDRKIWPKLRRKVPDAKIHIYGAYPTQAVHELHKPSENFLVHGRVDHTADVFQHHRVLLAPLRFGAGIKGKFIEAMQFGLPSITTPVGAEGIAEVKEWPGAVEDEPEQIIAKSLQLYTHKGLWQNAQQRGYELVNAKFNAETFPLNLKNRILELQENLTLHRQQNFIGQLLNHHQHQSTKFMSRWIEEKNKYV